MIFPGHDLPTRTAQQKRHKDHLFKEWCAKEQARCAAQRAIFSENLGPARARLEEAMLNRAWELLEAAECEAADALLEFVPEAAAMALLDEFFGD